MKNCLFLFISCAVTIIGHPIKESLFPFNQKMIISANSLSYHSVRPPLSKKSLKSDSLHDSIITAITHNANGNEISKVITIIGANGILKEYEYYNEQHFVSKTVFEEIRPFVSRAVHYSADGLFWIDSSFCGLMADTDKAYDGTGHLLGTTITQYNANKSTSRIMTYDSLNNLTLITTFDYSEPNTEFVFDSVFYNSTVSVIVRGKVFFGQMARCRHKNTILDQHAMVYPTCMIHSADSAPLKVLLMINRIGIAIRHTVIAVYWWLTPLFWAQPINCATILDTNTALDPNQ